MHCKYRAKLEICLIEGELREQADTEGHGSRHCRRRTDAEGGHGGSDGQTVVAFSINSRFAPPDIIFLYEVELRTRINPVAQCLTMLNVRGRRQIDAETKPSFPASLADTESTCSIAITKSYTLNFAQAEVRQTAPMRSLLRAWRHQILQLCDDIFFYSRCSAVRCSATVHEPPWQNL
jgi:hypothetical protein